MNFRTRTLLVGGVIGALIGLLAGWLYLSANVEVDEEGSEQFTPPTPATSLKLGLGMLSVLRQIVDKG